MEEVQLFVREENRRNKRNFAFHVPLTLKSFGKSTMRRPPTSPRSLTAECRDMHATKRPSEQKQAGSRVRSASTGRDKKSELHARYWAFLFGNLQRAVDEIYQTCESDESVSQCKEVMMMLDTYSRDFQNLIEWFKIKWAYETTPPPQRPTSLAWEIRKTSPGKIQGMRGTAEASLVEAVRRKVPFDEQLSSKTSSSVNSGDESSVSDVISERNETPQPADDVIEAETLETDKVEEKGIENAKSYEKISEVVGLEKIDEFEGEKVIATEKKEVNESPQHGGAARVSTAVNSSVDETVTAQLVVKDLENADSSVRQTGDTVMVVEEKKEMVHEITQTDREEDVDENGPKYRSVSLQTCPELEKEAERLAKQKNSAETRSVSTAPKAAVVAAKSPAKNSTTSTPVRPAWGVARPVVPNKSVPSRPAYSAVSRQPWGARPVPTTPIRQPSQPLGKLTRCRTVDEVRLSGKASESAGAAARARKPYHSQTNSQPLATGSRQPSASAPKGLAKNSPQLTKTLKAQVQRDSNLRRSGNDDRVSFSNSSSSLHSSSSSCTVIVAEPRSKNPSRNNVADEDGWVQVRSRSRFSPGNRLENLEPTLSQSTTNLKPRSTVIKSHPKTRFQVPSSANSMPSLAFTSELKKLPIEKSAPKKASKQNVSPLVKETQQCKKTAVKNVGKANEMRKSFEKYIDSCAAVEKEDKGTPNVGKDKGQSTDKEVVLKANAKSGKLEEEVISDAKVDGTVIVKAEEEKRSYVNEKVRSDIKIDSPEKIVDQYVDDDENEFDEKIKKNKETEEMLEKEIKELESADLELDMETGDEETDGETTETTGTEDERESDRDVSTPTPEIIQPSPKKEYQYETLMKGFSWAEHMDTLNELEKLVVQDCSKEGMTPDEQLDTLERLEVFLARHPGRAMELHQKLSSPSRKRSIPETVRRFQARQAKALAKREALQLQKAQKLRELLKKVNEVKAAKDKLIEEQRVRLELKLERAAANRSQHLKEIMRKAHDEESKLKEIAFINELEAQNKRHELMTQRQEQEDRLQGIHDERQRKQEEKAAKEAAVEERRKAIEAERQEKLEKLQERQRKRDEQADKKKQAKEKERQELAREKARDRTERLEALHAAQLEAQEELQKKIQLKQEESARRHEENMEQIRQKALESSILRCGDDITPRLVPYETNKMCTACNVLINSEVYLLSHLRGRTHLENVKNQHNGGELLKEEIEGYNIKLIVTAPADKIDPKAVQDRERMRSFTKKSKKIRLRMTSKGEEFLKKFIFDEKKDSPVKAKLLKKLKEIEKLTVSQGKGQWADTAVTALERAMGEIRRSLEKKDTADQIVFQHLQGFSILSNILLLDMDPPAMINSYLPVKCFVTACTTILVALEDCLDSCKFFLLSNAIAVLLDLLQHRLTILLPDKKESAVNSSSLPFDALANTVMQVISKALSQLGDGEKETDEFLQRIRDVVSYAVSVGVVDKLTGYCSLVRDPIQDGSLSAQFLLSALQLLTTLTARCKGVRHGSEDPTQLLATLKGTELVGAVSIIYGMLLHQDAPPRDATAAPPVLPAATVAVVLATIQLLRSVAELDLPTFQSILGAEGVSLQFRHIASYLLWYCSHRDREKALLHEVISLVGFFAVQHRDNQMILQSGTMPTVLQQLCNLPFPYFCNTELSSLLFPTLLACCNGNEENKVILQQEISYTLLEEFLSTEVAKSQPLVRLLGLSNTP